MPNRLLIASGLLLCRLASSLAAEPAAERPAIGSEVADLTFTDIRWLPRQLSELGESPALVIVLTTLDCPVVQRALPLLKQLDQQYRERKVKFLALNVGPEDTLVDVAGQAVRADLEFPVGKDFSGAVAAALGLTRTPECVVLDAKRRLVYRGRIDAGLRFGGPLPGKSRADLREALEDVLAGQEVRVSETPVDGCLITAPAKAEPRGLTYYRDVAPLVQKHCQSCHQPGQAAPFPLLTFEDVSGHAGMVAEVVGQRRMPPWHAAGGPLKFTNDPSLPAKDVATIVDWARGERAAGDPAEAPPPRPLRTADWLIDQPDLVIKMGVQEKIPATGYLDYRYAVLPHVFLRDTWVQQIQIKPGNSAVLHHCNMGYVSVVEAAKGEIDAERNFITGYVPGGDPMVLNQGVGFRIPAGSVIGLQLHYVTTGEETTDQTEVGFVFARETIQKQIQHFQCSTGRIEIPPGASHHPVRAGKTFAFDATGIGLFSHMHLRGKDMTFTATRPGGPPETLLTIGNYHFDWQASYRWPVDRVKFPKGTKIDCLAHYDNSAFNPWNPDPGKTVRHGEQTWDEMMFGFLFFTRDDEALNLTINPRTGHVVSD